MKDNAKQQLLSEWAGRVIKMAQAGVLSGRKPAQIVRIETIAGPRAGVLEILAGLEIGQMLRALQADESALLRTSIPFQFSGDPNAFMTGNRLRLEVGWPAELAENDIRLSTIGSNPKEPGRWIVGKAENGRTVAAGLGDSAPHYLFGGATGAGKSVGMRSALAQMARNNAMNGQPSTAFVLIDLKYGEGFGPLAHIPALVGPLAGGLEEGRAALAWTVKEMITRYERMGESGNREAFLGTLPRLVVAVDELQEMTDDPLAVEAVRRLASQGRAAKIHLMIGTQHPVQAVFGDPQIKRNLAGRVAFRTDDWKSSEVIIGGSSPRADRLLGKGDSYVCVPGRTVRVQTAYMTPDEMRAIAGGQPRFDAWPELADDPLGREMDSNVGGSMDPKEASLAIANAVERAGRDRLKHRFTEAGLSMPGNTKAARLRDWGRNVVLLLQENEGIDLRSQE